MDIGSKLATAGWFLRRPAFWPHMVEYSARKFQVDRDAPELRRAATQWARERAVPVRDALTTIGLLGAGEPLPQLDAAVLAAAEAKAAGVPVRMGGRGDLSLIYASVALARSERLVETGVAYGWSSLALLAASEGRPAARLISVDMPYPRLNNEAYVGAVVPDALRQRWTLLRLPDRNGLSRAIAMHGGSIDFCHYDSDKSWHGRTWAYPIIWKALAPGGLLISDDIQDNSAFREFVEARNLPFAVTESGGKFAGVCRKQGVAR